MPVKNCAYAAYDASGVLKPFEYESREPRDKEILVKVLYCGICHGDLLFAKAKGFKPDYPAVTGHEFIGEVVQTGSGVTMHKIGDKVGVGYQVDACRKCDECRMGQEPYCAENKHTCGSVNFGEKTYGGYGKYVVLNEYFGIPLPKNLKVEDAAPLLCAGITTYVPLVEAGAKKGNMTIAVVGLGGLGHLAVQFAKKMNPSNDVWVISRSRAKEEFAKQLGATGIIPADELSQHPNKFNFLINTMSAGGDDVNKHIAAMKPHGKISIVGAVGPFTVDPFFPFLIKNLTLQTSIGGGVQAQKEMLEFCAQNDIYPMVEHVKMAQVNEAWERVHKSDVKFRFVLDVADSYAQ